ncbi:Free1 [Thalictrum thalictroides]|uniref:Free1 n=1 Tax=Thalictrum thalictroides TaxID=46969 RepID=A0A7J6W2Q7_THATH|nr:Free1 [Thalictrum thalictroides]
MQQGDYSSSYYQQYPHSHPPPPHHLQNPNPNSIDLQQQQQPSSDPSSITYASAPPFASNYTSSDYTSNQNFLSNYSSYSQNPDPIPNLSPTAPPSSYVPNPNSNYQTFNPSPTQSSHQPSPFSSSFNPIVVQEHPASYSSIPPQQHQQNTSYYSPYDQHQSNYVAPPVTISANPNPIANPNSVFSSTSYPNSSYSQLGSSIPPVYDAPYESNLKFDNRGGGYNMDDNVNRYGVQQPAYTRSQSDVGGGFYETRPETGFHYDQSGIQGDLSGQNAYLYTGSKVEPYGARGTSGKSSSFAAFDDYGRSLSAPAKEQVSLKKVLKAVPKLETQQDVKNGVQKFRVKLLAETGGQTPMDVLCQIGLDGIRMLDPTTSRTLRIYPLETITRSEVLDSSIFAFWSKSTVDIEPRRIRLKSSSYTTNTILDIVTAATFQLKEIGGKDNFRSKQSDPSKQSEQPTEKKKGFTDWVNLIKPGNEEKDHWVPDEAVNKCTACGAEFGAFVRRHHCRNCGDIFCDKCTSGRTALTAEENAQPVRVCDRCLAEVTQRLSNAKESTSKPSALYSHEDLAKKLQEEMDKNRKASSGSKSSDGSGRRMREVACPTCTVHLQVQVPSSGSETIECGVCQHPFLVSAH